MNITNCSRRSHLTHMCVTARRRITASHIGNCSRRRYIRAASLPSMSVTNLMLIWFSSLPSASLSKNVCQIWTPSVTNESHFRWSDIPHVFVSDRWRTKVRNNPKHTNAKETHVNKLVSNMAFPPYPPFSMLPPHVW